MKKIGIVALACALLGAGTWWAYGRLQRDITINVTAAELSAKITPFFPLKKCALVCIEFANPQITLPPGSEKIELKTQLRASLGLLEFPGQARFTARPRYDVSDASVYLTDITIPEVSLAGMPENVIALVQQHGPLLANLALERQAVYRVADAGLAGEIAKRGLKDIRIVDRKMQLNFRALGH